MRLQLLLQLSCVRFLIGGKCSNVFARNALACGIKLRPWYYPKILWGVFAANISCATVCACTNTTTVRKLERLKALHQRLR